VALPPGKEYIPDMAALAWSNPLQKKRVQTRIKEAPL